MQHDLYVELKQELESIAAPLFDFSEQQVRRNGAFLPFGAILKGDSEVTLEAAIPDHEPATIWATIIR